MNGPVMMMAMITGTIGNVDGIAYVVSQVIAGVIAQIEIVRFFGPVYHSFDVRVVNAFIVMSAMVPVQSIPCIHIHRFLRFVIQLIDPVHLRALIMRFASTVSGVIEFFGIS